MNRLVRSKIFSICCAFLSLGLILLSPLRANAETEKVLDAVVASVNGTPITLSEVNAKLQPPRNLNTSQASSDPEFRFALDQMIQDLLVREEAKLRRLPAVSNEEVEGYLQEVAKRNGIDRSGLEAELKKEGINLESYKSKIEIDILKSKLAGALARDGAGVTNEDIDAYTKDHPELSQSGVKLKLRQILISANSRNGETRTDEQELQTIETLKNELNDGKDFSELAKNNSDGAEASEGGSLGVVMERDLSPAILDAILILKPGEVSEVVKTDHGYHLFLLEERFSEEDSGLDESGLTGIRDEIRAMLERQKIEEKMSSFFSVDLFKKHHVEKKI